MLRSGDQSGDEFNIPRMPTEHSKLWPRRQGCRQCVRAIAGLGHDMMAAQRELPVYLRRMASVSAM